MSFLSPDSLYHMNLYLSIYSLGQPYILAKCPFILVGNPLITNGKSDILFNSGFEQFMDFPTIQMVKNLPTMQEIQV